MKRWSVVVALGLLGAVLGSTPAQAATATASFSVSATVVSSCQATPPSASTYGSTPASMTRDASSVAVTCTLPTPYTVVARTVAASEVSAPTRKPVEAVIGSSQSRPLDVHDANEQNLPAVAHSETIIVTVSY